MTTDSKLAVMAAVDELFYARTYPDVLDSPLGPLKHFLFQGWRELRQPNEWFDPHWYAETYADVLAEAVSPLEHYVRWGWREGRQPHPSSKVQDVVRAAGRANPDLCPVLVLVARSNAA